MSYHDPRDPRDPRTARYEPGYPESRAYSQQPAPRSDHSDPTYSYAADPYQPADAGRQKPRLGPNVNPTMFVGGVVMTGVVTGLAAWLAAWIIRAIVQRVNEAGRFGVWNPLARDEFWFAVVAFLCALAAGALWYVLQMVTPSPNQFFRWIVGLLIAAAVIIPLILSAELSVGIATAILHLIIGLPIISLIPAMGHKSIQDS
ncbi:DUF6069 family protein [Gordonia sp. Z-3]|jgi:magnesium-transporting ATPase (P-type)|uniref:DUF6069 family protein n=3 Tax=Bacteria TaxID=2 RepID=A0A9X3D620_9ACTN|nr:MULTISPECIES: DUF6069 family protein [Gordonia]MAU83232.1 hypothetical protein [Gordonia sp. (in: high G+C Gram-positive bacteria)]MAU83644.1 hypothetical protein [Gordonia sp. (in: high G+C Gram-positive bacteria)]MCF3939128.1 DUF6069 family protein [Gordonia tangerina]MCX2964969.1 DUF6069 family protein [Gordonia aquimaris]MED5801336.1 DUF6069 family protein [Gordonia sp. Z-3]